MNLDKLEQIWEEKDLAVEDLTVGRDIEVSQVKSKWENKIKQARKERTRAAQAYNSAEHYAQMKQALAFLLNACQKIRWVEQLRGHEIEYQGDVSVRIAQPKNRNIPIPTRGLLYHLSAEVLYTPGTGQLTASLQAVYDTHSKPPWNYQTLQEEAQVIAKNLAPDAAHQLMQDCLKDALSRWAK